MREHGYEPLRDVILSENGLVPSVVLVEFSRVAMRRGVQDETVQRFFQQLWRNGHAVEAFTPEMGERAQLANRRFGIGNGNRGLLNLLDLMVYATAQTLDLPILCTGRDYASTDAKIHPASRPE